MLGELKFAFPNKHAVYMHDTTTKGLFEEVEPPVQPRLHARAQSAPLAEILLGEDKGWDAAKIADLIANGPTRTTRCRSTARSACTSPTSPPGSTTKARRKIARDVYGHEQRITQALRRPLEPDRQRPEPPRAGAHARKRLLRLGQLLKRR